MNYRRTIIHPTDNYFHTIEQKPRRKKFRHLHLLLFVATVLTTTAVGAVMAGASPLSLQGFLKGLPFSVTILSILGIHEFSHYFAARYWGIEVTLPYFIPAPILPIGTFGAVIKMKSSIPSRKALVDVGASGPIGGFVVALVAGIIGLRLSEVVPAAQADQFGYILGESLVFKAMGWIVLGDVPGSAQIMLHPVAFAAWIGLFVTALNLIPIGQLDGGHVLFALSPGVHELVRKIRFPLLILLGISFWSGWIVWAVLSVFFGRAHPYPKHMDEPLGIARKSIAVIAVILFISCITLTPISIG